MALPLYLAETAAEMGGNTVLPPIPACMACHFSPGGTGLSGLSAFLPPGSMLILDDSTPMGNHNPEQILRELTAAVERFSSECVLLDFQRPGNPAQQELAALLAVSLPCPVGVSEHYAKEGLACPVFLPPLPLHLPLAEYIAPWKGRPVWLELMPACEVYAITAKGCTKSACQDTGTFRHFDEPACCRYRIEVSEDAIRFILARGPLELEQLRRSEEIDCFVGLYQDFAQPEAQATALDQ